MKCPRCGSSLFIDGDKYCNNMYCETCGYDIKKDTKKKHKEPKYNIYYIIILIIALTILILYFSGAIECWMGGYCPPGSNLTG